MTFQHNNAQVFCQFFSSSRTMPVSFGHTLSSCINALGEQKYMSIILVTLVYSSLGATVATNFFSVHSNWNYLKKYSFLQSSKETLPEKFLKKCIPNFSSKRTTDPIYAKKWEGKVDWAFVCQGESLEYRSLWVSELGSQALNVYTWGRCELQLSFQGSQYHINRWTFRA